MHAFLLTGNSNDNFDNEINKLAKKISAKIVEFPLTKIDDVRSLTNLIRLSFSEKTLIVAKNINEVGEEAANAFLKNLEEPQENIYFALTAPSERSVLSTIVSRCQIIKSTNNQIIKLSNDGEVEQFLEMTKSEKLSFVGKLKDRDSAIKFINDLTYYLHSKKDLSNMEIVLTTLGNLKKNGNVSLHLTNLVVRMENTHG